MSPAPWPAHSLPPFLPARNATDAVVDGAVAAVGAPLGCLRCFPRCPYSSLLLACHATRGADQSWTSCAPRCPPVFSEALISAAEEALAAVEEVVAEEKKDEEKKDEEKAPAATTDAPAVGARAAHEKAALLKENPPSRTPSSLLTAPGRTR